MGTCGMYWEKSNTCRDWRGTLTGDHFENPGIDGRMVLNWMSQKSDSMALTGFIWLMLCTSGRLC